MTAQDILNAVWNNPKIAEIQKIIETTSASFADANAYSDIASRMIGEILSKMIPNIAIDERKELCVAILRGEHGNVNRLLAIIQRRIDLKNGIHIKPQIAKFPIDRANKIARSLIDKTVPDETIQRRANTGVENVCRSFQDSYYEENAKFRSDAGLNSYIVRVSSGKCCDWCDRNAGRYSYSKLRGETYTDVFRRHDNCRCTLTYEAGEYRQDVWTKKSWNVPVDRSGAKSPKVFTDEQASAAVSKNSLKRSAA